MAPTEKSPRILICEDHPTVADELEGYLHRLGCTVEERAVTGDEAFEKAERIQPDLVLVDINLPGRKFGLDAAGLIRANGGPPVILLADPEDRDRLRRAKSRGFYWILKPLRETDLAVAVDTALAAASDRPAPRPSPPEQEQLRMEDEYRKLAWVVKYSRELVGVATLDGRLVFLNDAGATMLGVTPDKVEKTHVMDVIAEHLHDRVRNDLMPTVRAGNTWEGDLQYRHVQTGELTDVHAMVFLVQDPETDKPLFLANISLDITDRVRMEAALRSSEEGFRTLVEESPLAISLIGPDGRYKYINPQFKKMFGYTLEDIPTGEDWFQKAFPDKAFRQRVIADWIHDKQAAVSGEPRHRIFPVTCKDGSLKQIKFQPATLENQDQFVIYEDITEQRRAEEALKNSEQRFRELFNSISDLVYTQDMEGRFVSINQAMCSLFGYGKEELVGRKASDFMKADLKPLFETEYLKGVQKNGYHEGVSAYHKKDGGKVYIEYRSRLIVPENGPPYISGIGTDVTRRIMAEREKKSLELQLQQAQKMEAVGRLAGGVAHDFNNLLQAINGYTQLLLLNKSQESPDHAKLNLIQSSVDRASRLVKQLLMFSRKMEAKPQKIDLNQEVAQSIKILERTLPKMVHIDFSAGDDLWTVKADPIQIEQILLNLGANAADAMPEGGHLSFTTDNVYLDDAAAQHHLGAQPGRYVLLTVSDTGHGMDESTMERIFEPFFTTKDIGKGTGLGLASVYGIIKNHGGCFTCHSELEVGTTFGIYLPAVEPEPTVGVAREAPQPPPRGSETILLVDDEEAIRDIAAETLQYFGYSVLTAESGEEALRIYTDKNQAIDLVILDIGMPGMGGYRCLKELRKIESEAKVIVASGYSMDGQVQQTLAAGAAGYLGKPYQLQDFLHKVRAVLDAPQPTAPLYTSSPSASAD